MKLRVLQPTTRPQPQPDYWPSFFEGGEDYRGWKTIFKGDRWWSWNGMTLGQSNSKENMLRAIDTVTHNAPQPVLHRFKLRK